MGEYDAFGAAERAGWTSAKVADGYISLFAQAADQAALGLIDRLAPEPGSKVLDLCCGHGHLSGKLAARGCDVTGVDFSEEMLERARRQAPGVNFQLGDAQDLPFGEGEFDYVICNLGMMHIPDQPRALAEARRVLKPDGRFAMTAWVGPDASPSFQIAFKTLMDHADPSKAGPPQPDFFQFARPDSAEALLSAAGFADIDQGVIDCVWRIEAPEDLFRIYSEGTVRMAMILETLTPEVIDAVRDGMAAAVAANHKTDEGYLVPVPAAAIIAKPA